MPQYKTGLAADLSSRKHGLTQPQQPSPSTEFMVQAGCAGQVWRRERSDAPPVAGAAAAAALLRCASQGNLRQSNMHLWAPMTIFTHLLSHELCRTFLCPCQGHLPTAFILSTPPAWIGSVLKILWPCNAGSECCKRTHLADHAVNDGAARDGS